MVVARRGSVALWMMIAIACGPDAASSDDAGGSGDAGVDEPLDHLGVCEPACVEASDCCDALGGNADYCREHLGEVPFDFACRVGSCEHVGCETSAECQNVGPGTVCHDVGDVGYCLVSCTGDDDCGDGSRCLDVLHDGFLFCRPYCESDGECPDGSSCIDGNCVFVGCTTDADCDPLTSGRCENGVCGCRENADCDAFHACKPRP